MTNLNQKIENETLIISIPESPDAAWAEEFVQAAPQLMEQNFRLLALDFSRTSDFKIQFYRPIMILTKLCREKDRRLVSFGYKDQILRQIKEDGLSSSLVPFSSLEEARTHFGMAAAKPKVGLDVNLINPFITATKNTLEIQAQTPSEPGKPFLIRVEEKGYNPPVGIAGVISISTEKFRGSITLVFPEAVFLKIYENMFGEKCPAITGEIEDAAGELINIIYGTAKTELNTKHGFDLKPVLPTILSGNKIQVRQRTSEKVMVLPFKTGDGQFQIEIAIEAA